MQSAIEYIYETDFLLTDESSYSKWLASCAQLFGATSISLVFSFMGDDAVHALNVKHLNHDTYTDIITFDDSVGKDIMANIAVSIDRVVDNASAFSEDFDTELLRVMAHGLLHCLGFNDKTTTETKAMRQAEQRCIELFHVEQNTTNHVS